MGAGKGRSRVGASANHKEARASRLDQASGNGAEAGAGARAGT